MCSGATVARLSLKTAKRFFEGTAGILPYYVERVSAVAVGNISCSLLAARTRSRRQNGRALNRRSGCNAAVQLKRSGQMTRKRSEISLVAFRERLKD